MKTFEQALEEESREQDNHVFRMEPWKEITHSDSFKKGAQWIVDNLHLLKKERCPCGGIILADTEGCTTPLCFGCYTEIATLVIEDIPAKDLLKHEDVRNLIVYSKEYYNAFERFMKTGSEVETMRLYKSRNSLIETLKPFTEEK